jgi:hypothetical protein
LKRTPVKVESCPVQTSSETKDHRIPSGQGISSARQVCAWLSDYGKGKRDSLNWTGSISFDTPLLYALGFIGLFTIGGMTGLFLASLGVNVHVTDTYFIVAHFHYIMVGGAMFGYLGGLRVIWPLQRQQ